MPEIVLVHGLWTRAWALSVLKKRLEKRGFLIRRFNYATSTRDPLESIEKLIGFCRETSSGSLHLVGHSLGGLMIMEMLRQLSQSEQTPLPPGRVVLLGSPLGGSEVAGRLANSTLGRLLLRNSESSLIDGVTAMAPDRECGMIAGNLPRGLGRLTGRFNGPNDGTVKVSETYSDVLTDHLEIRVTHTSMVFQAEVARQLVFFINNGRFDRPH
ncbi:MAG: pimeloyl-ACP methyl ester carboxylesterase [Lysobacterales bacterium]